MLAGPNLQTIPKDAKFYFQANPWCAALLGSSDIQTFTPPSYSPPDPAGISISRDQLFRHILSRQDAIPACIGFYHRPSESVSQDDTQSSTPRLLLDSASLLFDLQPGVNGFQGTVHGGFFAVLMDEAMGSLIYHSYLLQAQERAKGELPTHVMDLEKVNFVTAGIDMKLRKPLPTPKVVLVKATVSKLSGRKLVIHTTIEGEEGIRYAECHGTWIAIPRVRL
ncbi:hypothetical protein FSARC_5993 [Fusarium sarcochroum]|uniref:Thioesterase domain-containing protein n=1 Tax=Fusarium sarcochroum TaxID=1208366 RepID=A0A8H4TY70_9HYPO|nr:hypothetical protein FSARC_5993 [Fusarium sarcochroum]